MSCIVIYCGLILVFHSPFSPILIPEYHVKKDHIFHIHMYIYLGGYTCSIKLYTSKTVDTGAR